MRALLAASLTLPLLLLAPGSLAPAHPFWVEIVQVTPSGTPTLAASQPGCAVLAVTSTTMVVECSPSASGFTCDFPGVTAIGGNGHNSSTPLAYVPGEHVTGRTQCTGGPLVTATAPIPGSAHALSLVAGNKFPWRCEAEFSPLAIGRVYCGTPDP